MPRKPGAAAPDLAELAAEVARLRARAERLERAQPAAPVATRGGRLMPKVGGLPAGGAPESPAAPARRNADLNRPEAAPMIEPPESWNLGPPGLAGRRRAP